MLVTNSHLSLHPRPPVPPFVRSHLSFCFTARLTNNSPNTGPLVPRTKRVTHDKQAQICDLYRDACNRDRLGKGFGAVQMTD